MRGIPTTLVPLLLATGAIAQDIEFNRDVRPILSDNCFHCHGPDKGHRKAKLRLDDPEVAYRIAIVPGKPDASELIKRINAHGTKKLMPPAKTHKKLTAEEIATLTKWVAQGAKYQRHWAWEPPKPQVAPNNSPNFIDAWVRRTLAATDATLDLRPRADKTTLLRRLRFDLTGLPPTPGEVDSFRLKDYRRVVEMLLASEQYGERMAIYWLDLVRFADTVGYHGDQSHPIAPYRDWVIDAFNRNMRFDQFTIEQLAGDLLPNPKRSQIIATGYNRLLQTTHEGGAQAKEYLAIYAADRVRNFGSVWLGGTVGCAQCHDHKFDPYTTRDFYSLAAFFADVQELGDFKGSPNSDPTTRPPELVILSAADQKRVDEIDATMRKFFHSGEAKALQTKLSRERRQILKRGRRTMITKAIKPRVTRILPRGNWLDESGAIVQPTVPAFLPQIEKRGRATRLDLAKWLTRKDHPLTARVFVNRLWYLFFGRGLSTSLMDCGAQGKPPTHPELLDALALEFVRSGWDIKHMVRLIVNSDTYRQSSVASRAARAADPDNTWLARQGRWRLTAEMIRDNALSISGLLVDAVGGDSVKPYQPAGYYQHLNFPRRKYRHHTDDRQWRRGVYMHWQRQFLHPALKAFDAPTREECTAQRAVSNTPQAALTLLNDPTFVEAARAFAGRMLDSHTDDAARVARGFRLATSRQPSAAESAELLALLRRQRAQYRQDPKAAAALQSVGMKRTAKTTDAVELAAWTAVARVLLNLAETTTRH